MLLKTYPFESELENICNQIRDLKQMLICKTIQLCQRVFSDPR